MAALIAVIGLMMCANAGPLPARPCVMKAGYLVMAVDLHVHSFPGDGGLPPWDIAVEARRRRLDAVVLTNHNSTHAWRLARWLSPITGGAGGALLIPGVELTSVGYHLALVGVTEPVTWRQPAASVAAAVHGLGGAAIAAHPDKETWRFFDDAALVALDGVEVAHPLALIDEQSRRHLIEFYERARRMHPTIAAIGSSDFHHHAPVGLDRTYLFARTATQAGIVDAVRSGRTVACDGRGEAYGPPELVAMVGEDCRRDAAARPDGETASDRIGTWLVWLGVVALVVLGAEG